LIFAGVVLAELPEKVLKNVEISVHVGSVLFVLSLGQNIFRANANRVENVLIDKDRSLGANSKRDRV